MPASKGFVDTKTFGGPKGVPTLPPWMLPADIGSDMKQGPGSCPEFCRVRAGGAAQEFGVVMPDGDKDDVLLMGIGFAVQLPPQPPAKAQGGVICIAGTGVVEGVQAHGRGEREATRTAALAPGD